MYEPVHLIVVSGPDKGMDLSVAPEQQVMIGRAFGLDLKLSDNSVGQRHCRIKHLGYCVQVDDLGCINGVLVNGTRINATMTLDHGVWIDLGLTRLELIFKSKPELNPKVIIY